MMASPEEITELQEALTKIENIARMAKLARQEETLVNALEEIADIADEFFEDEGEDEEPGEEEEP